jgi:transposase
MRRSALLLASAVLALLLASGVAGQAIRGLSALDGVGPDTAATLLIAAGDNPERLRSEASFAHLCGTAPVQASSGKVVRHRLNRGGNRDANRALHVVALNRMRRDPRTQEYVARRTAEGKSKKEVIRYLKRYIARETYRAIVLDAQSPCVPPT